MLFLVLLGFFPMGADGGCLYRDIVAPNHCRMSARETRLLTFRPPTSRTLMHPHRHMCLHIVHTHTCTHSYTLLQTQPHTFTHRHAYMHVPLTYLQPHAFAHS